MEAAPVPHQLLLTEAWPLWTCRVALEMLFTSKHLLTIPAELQGTGGTVPAELRGTGCQFLLICSNS